MIDKIKTEIKEYFHKHLDEKGIEIDLLDVNVAVMDILDKYEAQERTLEQIKWERDCAIQQLEELGTTLGEKPEIARQRIQEQKWISVEERSPKDYEIVNIVWVNRNPVPYYADIKDKPFVETGVFYRGKWYWHSANCVDYLKEYGGNYEEDLIDKDIEIIAWQPIPKYHFDSADKKVGG